MAVNTHRFKTPKKRTYKGKKYLILGYKGTVNKRAIAQVFTKYGWRDVINLQLLSELYKKI